MGVRFRYLGFHQSVFSLSLSLCLCLSVCRSVCMSPAIYGQGLSGNIGHPRLFLKGKIQDY